MKKPHHARTIAIVAAIAATIGGCIHQYPEGNGVDPTLVNVELQVTIDEDPTSHDPADRGRAGANSSRRLVIEARRDGKTVDRQIITTHATTHGKITFPVSLDLHALDYTLVAWSDHGKTTTGEDLHHATDNLDLVTRATPYTGNADDADCFRGSSRLDLRDHRQWNTRIDANLHLERPVARYKLVATDVANFLEDTRQQRANGETYTITLHYDFYLPLGINALTGDLARSEMKVSFTAPLAVEDDGSGEWLVAHDYILAGTAESYIPATIEIHDSNGKGISRTTGINIPYKRGHLTTLRGRFLTARFDTGIGIDPEFDDNDINIDLDEISP